MKLLIGVPTLDYVLADFMRCLIALIGRLNADGVEFDVDIESGTLVYFARERIANRAINEGYTHVLWLDSDMIFKPELLDDLMFSGKPFVSGIYHARRPGYASCIFKAIDPNKMVEHWNDEYPRETFEIAGCGFGCVLIETEILRDVNHNFGTCFTPVLNMGEDLAFCKRAHDLGHKIYCEPSVVLGHVGHITIYPEDHERWKTTISNYGEV